MFSVEPANTHEQAMAAGLAMDVHRLQAVVLLAGGASLNAFAEATERSVLDLPLAPGRSLLSYWRAEVAVAAAKLGCDALPVRVVGGARSRDLPASSPAMIQHLEDPQELRGTGGVLRDVAADYPEQSYVLVANAASLVLQPLDEIVRELLETRAEVAFHVHDDGSASSIMLIRSGCLKSIAPIGFVDLKEQALPAMASAKSVSAVRRRDPVAISLRSPSDYVRGLRTYHLRRSASVARGNGNGNGNGHAATVGAVPSSSRVLSEDWRPVFQIAEDGAEVEGGARLHDAVVLAGARVGRNAVVVRSVVCPGARVPADGLVVDGLVRRPVKRSRIAQSGAVW